MSWSIFITTIPSSAASFRELLSIYGLRWRIESIFKAWKSNMNFATIHNVSENQLQVLLVARLTMVVIYSHMVYRPGRDRIRDDYGRELSMMKTTHYLAWSPERMPAIVIALRDTTGPGPVLTALARYCTYGKRERPNSQQTQESLFDSWALG